jgi:hypothetical protein
MRHDDHGRNPHLAADVAIYAGIALGIVAAQRLARAHALAGESKLGGQQSAQLRRVRSAAGSAEHVVLAIAAQGDCRSARACDVLRAVRQQLQRSIEVALRHLGQRMASVFSREAHTRSRIARCKARFGFGARGSKGRGDAGLHCPV